jgi:hypothetical protein
LEARKREGPDVVKRNKGEFTEEESKEKALRNSRLGIWEGEDLEDVQIMGVE